MKKTMMLLFCAFWAAGTIAAQSSGASGLAVSIAYFGETITHPGIAVDASYPILESGAYRLSVGLMAGWYIHPRNHEAFFLLGGFRNALTAPFGLFGDLAIQAGVISTAPDGPVYSYSASDDVVAIESSGSMRFMANVSLGGGWEGAVGGGNRLAFAVRVGAIGEYPFNGYLYLHPFLETGVTFRFDR